MGDKAPEVEGTHHDGEDGHDPEGEEDTHLVVVGKGVPGNTLKLQREREEPSYISSTNLTQAMPST